MQFTLQSDAWHVFMFQVCELDIIFNFEKAYYILDEFLMGGEVQETSKIAVGGSMEEADTLQEVLWKCFIDDVGLSCFSWNMSLCLCSHHRRWRSTWANPPTEPREGEGVSHLEARSKRFITLQHFYFVTNNDSFDTMLCLWIITRPVIFLCLVWRIAVIL